MSRVQGQISSYSADYLRSLHCENGSGQFPYVCCAQSFNQFGGQWQHPPTPPPPQRQPPPPPRQPQAQPTLRQVTTHLSPSTNLVRTNSNPSPPYHQHQHHSYPQQRQQPLNGGELPGPGVCGLTSLAHRIFGGEETNLDDYSWIALLEYQPRKYIHIQLAVYCFNRHTLLLILPLEELQRKRTKCASVSM